MGFCDLVILVLAPNSNDIMHFQALKLAASAITQADWSQRSHADRCLTLGTADTMSPAPPTTCQHSSLTVIRDFLSTILRDDRKCAQQKHSRQGHVSPGEEPSLGEIQAGYINTTLESDMNPSSHHGPGTRHRAEAASEMVTARRRSSSGSRGSKRRRQKSV